MVYPVDELEDDSIDLEQEFRILMRTLRKTIDDKVSRGELTSDEASSLNEMVDDRVLLSSANSKLVRDERGWQRSGVIC